MAAVGETSVGADPSTECCSLVIFASLIAICSTAAEPFREERNMMLAVSRRSWRGATIAAAIAVAVVLVCCGRLTAAPQAKLAVGANAIGGQVKSANGPEAGVWVIAETTDLPTKFAKMVVTDDLGRFVIPDLPPA